MAEEKQSKKAQLDGGVHSERVSFALDHYRARNTLIDNIIKLYKQDFSTSESKADMVDIGGGEKSPMVKPGRSQAIVNKYQTAIWQQSDLEIEVMPLRRASSRGEDRLCGQCEDFLNGVVDESDDETYGVWKFASSWWFLMGGMMTLKTLFFPQLRDSEQFPIKIFAPSAKNIYPVYANKRLLYVVERYDRYVMSLRDELEALYYRNGQGKVWDLPSFFNEDNEEQAGTDEVEVIEYWDDTYKVLTAGGQVVWNQPHLYPCIPYAIGYCLPTPLDDSEWRGRPVMASSEDAVKQEALQLTKLVASGHTHYYPLILVESEDGEVVQLQTGPGFETTPIKPGTQLQVINPTPNIGLLQALLGSFQGEIERNTLPALTWGLPASPAESGYAKRVRYAGTEADLRFMSQQLVAVLAHGFSNVLKITEAFAGDNGFAVYAKKRGAKRHELITMKEKDIAGHHKVRVGLRPNLDRDLLEQIQVVRLAREGAERGDPILPMKYLRREVLRVADPVELQDMLDEELISQDPVVLAHRRKVALDQYCKRHGISDEERAELEARVSPQGAQPEVPGQQGLSLPIVPSQMAVPGMPPMPGLPWGISPEMLPPEEGMMGRTQQIGPEAEAALAEFRTGRPPGA